MTAANYDQSFANTVGVEGGLSLDSHDPGNWTGGKIGVGTLEGTKYGISAAQWGKQYDILSLTLDQAKLIYRRHYWNVCQCDYLASGVDFITFDGGVLSGDSESERWLQQACGATVDGWVGPETIAAAAKVPAAELIKSICEIRLAHLETDPNWDRYGKGWTNRVNRVQAEALAMVG